MTPDKKSTALTYEIGYGKPPRSGCFKKGQRANPKGRPRKRPKDGLTIIREEADMLIKVRDENGRTRKLSKFRVGFRNAMNQIAKTGDIKSLLALMKLPGMAALLTDNVKEEMADDEKAAIMLREVTIGLMSDTLEGWKKIDQGIDPFDGSELDLSKYSKDN